MKFSIGLVIIASVRSLALASSGNNDALTVRASTGFITGRINANYSNVREFLSVPFGQDTSGPNRFQPPLAVPLSSERIDATEYAPACPQYVTSQKTIWNQKIPQYLQSSGAPNNTAGISAPFATEDCLKLAIWTPANVTYASRLPVAMFWTGGGLQTNGILVSGQLPGRWVSRSQSHVVVTINYRMNIMGFPNAGGIATQNLGLLDQRLALEWVRDNIAAFGGDASKITIWGQSAGAASVDIHNYAFYNDPIARGFFAQSASIIAFLPSVPDATHSNFTFVAKNVGCDFPTNFTAELECMQQVDYNDMINFMGRYQDNDTQPAISFSTVADEKLVFSNYTERYLQRRLTRAPMIYSSTANEGGSLSGYPADDPQSGINQTQADQTTLQILCGAAKSGALRQGLGLPTYRYQYAGNWTNQNPLPWMGAYHSSDLVMFFGTYEDGVGPASPLETETSETMQDLLLDFVRDPWNGLSTSRWPAYDPTASNGGTLLRFGADGEAVQEVDANAVQAACSGEGEYDPFP
ncbi:Carboxylic ester hydrolase [Cercospora zeina]